MLLEGIEIDDTTADRLLTAFGAEPEDFSDPDRRREAVGLLLLHGLELLEAAAATPTTPGDRREVLETSLLALAGAPRTLPVEMDARGVPYQIWLPALGWLPLDRAPDGWRDLETALAGLRETLAAHASLRTSATVRRLPTNEEVTEIVFADAATPVAVEVRLDGRLFRFRLDPATALVSGMPLGDPEAVPEHR
jgi:hypothetical protein